MTREYRDTVPGAVLVPIHGAGHVIWDDQPDAYAELVGTFLRGEPLPREPFVGEGNPWAPRPPPGRDAMGPASYADR